MNRQLKRVMITSALFAGWVAATGALLYCSSHWPKATCVVAIVAIILSSCYMVADVIVGKEASDG